MQLDENIRWKFRYEGDFKYKLDEVWDMSVYAFYDALKSINIIENSNHLSIGAYSGNIDTSKINKKEFNWLREA